MKKCLVLLIGGILGVFLLVNVSLAEEAVKQPTVQKTVEETAPPISEGPETEFSYGTVKSVSSNQIVVSEYDYDKDQDVDVTYTVPADVKLENAASLQEIAVGGAVDIDFLMKDGQKVASAITVEKPIAEDEEVALGSDEPKTDEQPQTG